MVISCSTCQKGEKEAFRLNIGFTLFCRDFKFVIIYVVFFTPNLHSQNFNDHKKKFQGAVSQISQLMLGSRNKEKMHTSLNSEP